MTISDLTGIPRPTILRKLNKFKPEFILFSAGFDAHKDDPLSNINLKSQDYFEITKNFYELTHKGDLILNMGAGDCHNFWSILNGKTTEINY